MSGITLKFNTSAKKLGLTPGGGVQKFVDSEVLRLCRPLVPFRFGPLVKSGTLYTKIGSGEVEYNTPYAWRQYLEHKSKSRWFEVMKARSGGALERSAAAYARRLNE